MKAKPEDFKQLDEILKLVAEKKFQVVIGKSFPLAETRAAQRYLDTNTGLYAGFDRSTFLFSDKGIFEKRVVVEPMLFKG